MAGKRLGAFVMAAVLVLAAVGIRRWIDSGGEVTLGGTPSPVYCDPLVGEACKAAFPDREVRIEAPGATLDRLLDSRDGESLLWVTADVWVEILQTERARLSRGAVVSSVSDPVASTPLVLVGGATLTDQCPIPSWECLADGPDGLDVGLDSRDSTVGLLSQGQLVTGFLGTPTFASNDLQSLEYRQWRTQSGISEGSATTRALDRMLTAVGTFDVAPAALADWQQLGRTDMSSHTPPDAGSDIVIVVAAIGAAGGSSGDLEAELVERDWLPGGGSSAAGPSAGVLEALRVEQTN
jgi:hypothetical protein